MWDSMISGILILAVAIWGVTPFALFFLVLTAALDIIILKFIVALIMYMGMKNAIKRYKEEREKEIR